MTILFRSSFGMPSEILRASYYEPIMSVFRISEDEKVESELIPWGHTNDIVTAHKSFVKVRVFSGYPNLYLRVSTLFVKIDSDVAERLDIAVLVEKIGRLSVNVSWESGVRTRCRQSRRRSRLRFHHRNRHVGRLDAVRPSGCRHRSCHAGSASWPDGRASSPSR